MPRFHFHLRARGMIHRDHDGTELPDLAAARAHALTVARELMDNSNVTTRHWSIRVENDADEKQLDMYFADVDPRLDAYPPEMRMHVSKTCRRLGALTDVICATRATWTEARMLLARAQGRPQLVFARRE